MSAAQESELRAACRFDDVNGMASVHLSAETGVACDALDVQVGGGHEYSNTRIFTRQISRILSALIEIHTCLNRESGDPC